MPIRVSQKEIIATYSWRSFPILLVLLAVTSLFLFFWYVFATDPADFFYRGVYITYALAIGSLFYLVALPTILRFFWRVLFDGGRAVWIENDCLIYLDHKFFMIPCANVAAISSDEEYGQAAVSIILKDGRKKVLPVGLLSSTADVVAKRIKEIRSL